MRPLASIVWITALAFSLTISGVLPTHLPWSAAHALADPLLRSAANQSGSPYAPYAPGYGSLAPCQIDPSTPPPNWPTGQGAPQPFSSDFSQFLANTVHIAPNSAPHPISITQQPTTNISPRTGFSMPYQLLYNQQYPGPTIRVTSQQQDGSTLQVGPDTTLAPPPVTQLAINNGVIGQVSSLPAVPFPYFTTHLHGGHTAPEHDGHPSDLLPPMPTMSGGVGSAPAPAPAGHIYTYTNDQQPQILWYHDHADMNTSPHVSAGLYAFYIIEENEQDPNYPYLPQEPYDIPLGFQVMQAGTQTVSTPHGNQTIPVYFVAVNGLDSPALTVEARRYRFRLLNASAGQSVSLELCDQNGNNVNNLAWVIGTDGGLLYKPVNLPDRTIDLYQDGRLDVFQAERYDLIVDFTNVAPGESIYLSSIVRGVSGCTGTYNTVTPPTAQQPTQCVLQESPILKFNVVPPTSPDNSNIAMIGNQSWVQDTQFLQDNHSKGGQFSTKPDRQFTFEVNAQFTISEQPYDMLRLTYGGTVDDQGKVTSYPSVIHPTQIQANTVDLWELVNLVHCGTHPVHVHDIEFQNVSINGTVLTPDQVAQFGWKDIFLLPPVYDPVNCPWVPMNTNPSISFMGYYESHWIQSVAPPSPQIGDTIPWLQTGSGNYTALTSGTYVFHCHNLGHEDDVMMGQFTVMPPPFTPPAPTPTPSTGFVQPAQPLPGMTRHGGG